VGIAHPTGKETTMQEHRRFFRYWMPSLVLIVEVFIYLCVTDFEQIKCLFQTVTDAANSDATLKFIAIIITGFLASGGIGYLLGTIYHVVFFNVWKSPYTVDHLQLLKSIPPNLLKFTKLTNDGKETELEINSLTTKNAWHIVTSFVNERLKSSKRIGAANERFDSFVDIMHGAGAALVGSVVAFIFWLSIHYQLLEKSTPNCWFFLIPVGVSTFHFFNFWHVAKAYQGIINIVVLNEIYEEYSAEYNPLIIRIPEMDLKK